MSSELDVPNLPFPKPRMLSKIEEFGPDQREAMDPVEMKERTEDAAEALAVSYHKHIGGDYNGCVGVVTQALTETGACLAGEFGATMIAHSSHAARAACKVIFKKNHS